MRFLWRNAHIADKCIFATAPDILGDAEATLQRARVWLKIIRDLGMPAGIVGQDGLEHLSIPWDSFDALFVGGSTEWKLGPGVRKIIKEAIQRNKWVHVGRMNSQTRLEYCIKLGVNSIDGTEWAINPGRGVRWASNVMKRMELQKRLL